jgi:hypothetical protein
MISLEARGLLGNKFHTPFRTSKPWRVNWNEDAIEVDYKAPYEGMTGSPNAKGEDSDTD